MELWQNIYLHTYKTFFFLLQPLSFLKYIYFTWDQFKKETKKKPKNNNILSIHFPHKWQETKFHKSGMQRALYNKNAYFWQHFN